MINIGSIINTHTGPARVTVMLPAYMKGGTQYSEALTQSVGGGTTANGALPADIPGQTNQPAAPAEVVSTVAKSELATFVVDADAQDFPADKPVAVDPASQALGSDKSKQGRAEGKASAWEPTGLAKISALYKSSAEIAAAHSRPNLNVLG